MMRLEASQQHWPCIVPMRAIVTTVQLLTGYVPCCCSARWSVGSCFCCLEHIPCGQGPSNRNHDAHADLARQGALKRSRGNLICNVLRISPVLF